MLKRFKAFGWLVGLPLAGTIVVVGIILFGCGLGEFLNSTPSYIVQTGIHKVTFTLARSERLFKDGLDVNTLTIQADREEAIDLASALNGEKIDKKNDNRFRIHSLLVSQGAIITIEKLPNKNTMQLFIRRGASEITIQSISSSSFDASKNSISEPRFISSKKDLALSFEPHDPALELTLFDNIQAEKIRLGHIDQLPVSYITGSTVIKCSTCPSKRNTVIIENNPFLTFKSENEVRISTLRLKRENSDNDSQLRLKFGGFFNQISHHDLNGKKVDLQFKVSNSLFRCLRDDNIFFSLAAFIAIGGSVVNIIKFYFDRNRKNHFHDQKKGHPHDA